MCSATPSYFSNYVVYHYDDYYDDYITDRDTCSFITLQVVFSLLDDIVAAWAIFQCNTRAPVLGTAQRQNSHCHTHSNWHSILLTDFVSNT